MSPGKQQGVTQVLGPLGAHTKALALQTPGFGLALTIVAIWEVNKISLAVS